MMLQATLLLAALAAEPGEPITATVECPVGVETRIVFPGPVRELRTPPPGIVRALRLRVVAAAPKAIIAASPSTTPLEGVVVFEGPDATATVRLVAVAAGKGREVTLGAPSAPPSSPAPSVPPPVAPRAARPVAPRAAATPAPLPATRTPAEPVEEDQEPEVVVLRPVWVDTSTPAPPIPASSPSPTLPAPASPAPVLAVSGATPAFDAAALALAKPQRIGREEGLPGRRTVVLEDALRGDALVWLRFRVPGGAKGRFDGARSEKGALQSVMVVPEGKDLRVVVQLPRREVSGKTQVEIRVDGVGYRFPLTAPWFSSFLRSLF